MPCGPRSFLFSELVDFYITEVTCFVFIFCVTSEYHYYYQSSLGSLMNIREIAEVLRRRHVRDICTIRWFRSAQSDVTNSLNCLFILAKYYLRIYATRHIFTHIKHGH